MKKILVLGANGMLGHQLCRMLSNRMDVWGTVHDSAQDFLLYRMISEKRLLSSVDALDKKSLSMALTQAAPDAVVNAIGIVKQRDEAHLAVPSIQINALFPHILAELCLEHGTRLVHISTDCVFSGLRGNYTEADLPDPVDLYGRTKLLGEINLPGCLTLRTSIIGWELNGRSSLLEWFASQRSRRIKGYQKAIFSGFSTAVLANLIGDLIETRPDLSGLYHVTSKPISKYDLLVKLRDTLGWSDIEIEGDSHFFCDRSLVGTRFERMTGWQAPAWDEMIQNLAAEWPQYAAWRGENP